MAWQSAQKSRPAACRPGLAAPGLAGALGLGRAAFSD